MEEITVTYLEAHLEELIGRVRNGESFSIFSVEKNAVIAQLIPSGEELDLKNKE